MKAFHEHLRYEYDLTQDSFVIDAGGYEGNWMKQMFEKHRCKILVFEPVYDNWQKCSIEAARLDPDRKSIEVIHGALGGGIGIVEMHVSGDSTGAYSQAEKIESSDLYDASLEVSKPIDVLKLNIEGMEFDVLERLISTGLITRVKNIQVQFHRVVPDFDYRYARLREALLTTHEPEWDSEIVWQNWRLK